mmetsp:Transcript_10631/g.13911  ORF Transcript_10631/g.13911 Transcript_10631/m.13911 type:complete len:197 (-) Transcript_10631:844-1434(-)
MTNEELTSSNVHDVRTQRIEVSFRTDSAETNSTVTSSELEAADDEEKAEESESHVETFRGFEQAFNQLVTENEEERVIDVALNTIHAIIRNATSNPNRRSLPMNTERFSREVASVSGGIEILKAVGFVELHDENGNSLTYQFDETTTPAWVYEALDHIRSYRIRNVNLRDMAAQAATRRLQHRRERRRRTGNSGSR